MNLKPTMRRTEVLVRSGSETLVGDLVDPGGKGPYPAVLFVTGGVSIDRFHRSISPEGYIHANEPVGWFSDRLAASGIAVFSWDKRGVGGSTGGDRQPGEAPGDRDSHTSVETDVCDAMAALCLLRSRPIVDPTRITVVGHSAGVYFASLLAERSDVPASYVLWSGIHMGIESLMRRLLSDIRRYAARGFDEADLVNQHFAHYSAQLDVLPEIVAAAAEGLTTYEWSSQGRNWTKHLTRLRQELDLPRGDQIKNIRRPSLVIHGAPSVAVPVSEAFAILRELEGSGNEEATLVIVPGADHRMRVSRR
jgi:uncharacterized protein